MCYGHTQALHDSKHPNDATLFYCDTNDPTGNPCGKDYQNKAATVTQWKRTTTGSHGLQTLYEGVER
jgi:hypothetical protein